MKFNRNHKTIVTACLLALYVFVSTPVSYWHHHETYYKRNNKEQIQKVEKESQSAFDANCKICSHHYSEAVNDAVTVHFLPITFFNPISDYHLIKKIANPGYAQSNKGPPAKA